jgi:hypothetical protein
LNQEEIIIKGDNCDTGRTWGRDYLFYFFVKQRGKQGGFDYGYECMVPYGCSVSIFYAMWICYGGGWFYQIKECR